MSDPILARLQHDDPEQRKRGISAAVKANDRRYLKALAYLVKTDPDPSVKEMAKKAGTRIHKQTQSQGSAPVAPKPSAAPPPQPAPANLGDLLANVGEAKDPEQAAIHYDKAFELQLKGMNARAALELGTAFFLNPAYANDGTAVAFAAEMTGLPPQKAVAYISNPENWRKLTDKHGGFKGEKGEQSDLTRLAWWFAGAIVLILIAAVTFNILGDGVLAAILQQTIDQVTGNVSPTIAPPVTEVLTPVATPQ
jgi:hypothetical protein